MLKITIGSSTFIIYYYLHKLQDLGYLTYYNGFEETNN